MTKTSIIIFLRILISNLDIFTVLSGTAERRLLGDLLEYYQKFERPVANEADAIQLKFGFVFDAYSI